MELVKTTEEKPMRKVCSDFLLCKCTKSDCPYIHPYHPLPRICSRCFFTGFCEKGLECDRGIHIYKYGLSLYPCFTFLKYGGCDRRCHDCDVKGISTKMCKDCKCPYGHYNINPIDTFKIIGAITRTHNFEENCGMVLNNPFNNELKYLFVEVHNLNILFQLYYNEEVEPLRYYSRGIIPKRNYVRFMAYFKVIFVEIELVKILYEFYSIEILERYHHITDENILDAHQQSVKLRIKNRE